jgi:hypothetical protein
MSRGESTPPESIASLATTQAAMPVTTVLQTPAINSASKPPKPVKPAKPSSTQNLGTLISSYISSSSSGNKNIFRLTFIGVGELFCCEKY